ncbi:MAG: AMIN-like domain-containing (lipo)protein [Candidatus Limnocylindria bacterium]
MQRTLPTLALALLVGLAACQASTSPTPSAAGTPVEPSAPPDSPAGTSTEQPSPSASQTTEPMPSGDLGEFSCELPIIEQATTPRANIVDDRVGTHDGFDRVVFEFTSGTPELTLDRAQPPFAEDGSGFPVNVEGDAFLGLVMRGGTKQMETGESSYDGPTDFDSGFPTLVHLVEGGDFEAQSTWYLGVTHEACARVLLLDGPSRVVIDVEH